LHPLKAFDLLEAECLIRLMIHGEELDWEEALSMSHPFGILCCQAAPGARPECQERQAAQSW